MPGADLAENRGEGEPPFLPMNRSRRQKDRGRKMSLPFCPNLSAVEEVHGVISHSLAPIPLTAPWAVQPKTLLELAGEWGQGNQRMGIACSGDEPQDASLSMTLVGLTCGSAWTRRSASLPGSWPRCANWESRRLTMSMRTRQLVAADVRRRNTWTQDPSASSRRRLRSSVQERGQLCPREIKSASKNTRTKLSALLLESAFGKPPA